MRLFPLHRCLAVTALLLAGSALAAPAPWFQWHSLVNGGRTCAQTSPGEGWARADGPYRDAQCRHTLRVIRL